jgi:hypothetical protein
MKDSRLFTLEVHSRLVRAYDKSQDIESQREVLETVIARLKEQYRWGHISKQEYLREYQQTETQLRQLAPARDEKDKLKGLAHFLSNVLKLGEQLIKSRKIS